MKRKFLEDMGLEKEQIDSIMAENGKDIQREKDVAESYKKQVEDVQGRLKEFEGVDVKDLQGKVKSLTDDLAKQKETYEGQIADINFNNTIKDAISKAGGKNDKAVMALLDIESLKASKNLDTDLKTALETCQKENDYLFKSTEPINNPTAPTGGINPPTSVEALMTQIDSVMGI